MYKFFDFSDEMENRVKMVEKALKDLTQGNDPEIVHRCRVSVRRVRGILKLFGSSKEAEWRIKNISEILGPLRDIEVRIRILSEKTEEDPTLLPVLDDLLYERELVKRGALKIMPTFSGENFLHKIRSSMDEKKRYKYDIYVYLYKRVADIIGSWPVSENPKDAHELRINIKKIRYMLELVSEKDKKYEKLILTLKNYQDCLGEIHDFDVWVETSLERWSQFNSLINFLNEKRHSKIVEFKSLVHEIPETLKKILETVASEISEEFEVFQEMRSIRYSREKKILMAQKFTEEFSEDLEHLNRVRERSVKIFEILKGVFGLNAEDRYFLETGALLHDIGYIIPYGKHNVNSFRMISFSDYLPFSFRERIIIALMVKNHRGKIEIKNKFEKILPRKEIDRIMKLSSILRTADGMDLGESEWVKDFSVDVSEGKLEFRIGNVSENLKNRLYKKSALLRELFEKYALEKSGNG